MSFVNLNSVSSTQFAELVLKRNVPMVFLLIGDVTLDLFNIGRANRKDTVPGLPVEIDVRRYLFLDPFRRFRLRPFDYVPDRELGR